MNVSAAVIASISENATETAAIDNERSEDVTQRTYFASEVHKADDIESAPSRNLPVRRNVAGA